MRHPGTVLVLLATLGCGSSSASPPATAQGATQEQEKTGPDGVPAVTAPAVPSTAPVAAPPAPSGPADDACSNAALELPRGTVVATVDGEPIRAEALGDDGRNAERDALHTYCREVYRIRTATTRRAVDDHLLARAARDKGVGTDEFVRTLQSGGEWPLVHEARPGAALLAQGAQILFPARDQEDVGAGLRRAPRHRQPDSRGGAGDDDRLLVQGLEVRSGHETAD